MWKELNSLRSKITSNPSEVVCFLLDTGIAEFLKWSPLIQRDASLISPEFLNDLILEFPLCNSEAVNFVDRHQPDKVLFWLSCISPQLVSNIKEFLSAMEKMECILVGNFNEQLLKVSLNSEDGGMDRLLNLLHPVVPTIYFLPTYSFSILPSGRDHLDLQIITNHSDRDIYPLTLSTLCEDIENVEQKCIYDVNAVDLPVTSKNALKHLAHSISGSIVCNLGIDIADSIFAVGKTASLVGHSVLSMLEGYTEIRSGKILDTNSNFQDLSDLRDNKATSVPRLPLESGSLILVDRLEDLFSPIIQGGEQPVFHRVLNAVKMDALQETKKQISENNDEHSNKKAEILIDISLQPDWSASLYSVEFDKDETSPDKNVGSIVAHPMNAVSTLSVHAIPSICLTNDQIFDVNTSLTTEMMTGSEERGRNLLVDTLKKVIVSEKGSLPPAKKRGIGAEILALVQSLIKAPGYDSSATPMGEPSLGTISRSQSLLSLSITIIETMQRSSARQFSSVCSWKAALDTRIARETEWLKILRQSQDTDTTVDLSLSSIHRPFVASREQSDTDGPIDISHVLLLTIGLLGYLRFKDYHVEIIQALSDAMARHILLFSSDEELQYLRHLGVLTSAMEDIIAEARFEGITEDTAEYTLPSMSLLLVKRFSIFKELQIMYRHVLHRIVAKKVAETKNIPLDSSMTNRDYVHQADTILRGSYELQFLEDLFKPDSLGVLARLVEDCFLYHRTRQCSPLSLLLEHVQSPFQQMKNTGLELLSKGLGSFGFGLSRVVKAAVEIPHPGTQKTIVIFMLGGITYKEVAQVRNILDKYLNQDQNTDGKWKIILLTNRTISSEEVIAALFRRSK